MVIRPARPEDAPRLLALLSQVLEIHARLRPDIFVSGNALFKAEDMKTRIRCRRISSTYPTFLSVKGLDQDVYADADQDDGADPPGSPSVAAL